MTEFHNASMGSKRRRLATIGLSLAGALIVGTGIGAATPVTAAPTTVSSEVIGDGVWAPSHDEKLAIIPLCQPLTLLNWLNANFTDHGEDIAKFIQTNFFGIVQVVAFSRDPWKALQLVLTPFLQVPVYAINDTTFHVPATVGDILTFCASARA